ncbi:MAG: FRG domain-containing protein [Erysipelotrichaceae bacterium]|nr:FRG domain-containing protein [Erysipelotrichaceae bacterium]
MNYLYELFENDRSTKAAFFEDPNFGFFLFTEKYDHELTLENECNLEIKGNSIFISKGFNYQVYRIQRDDKLVYAFALNDITNKPRVEALSLDDLPINGPITIYTGGEVLEYLASICKLPNGNYVCGNVQDYISVVEDMSKKYPNKEHFFRGHYHYDYLLVPSLYRNPKYYNNESYMYMDFKTQFYNELSNKKYIEILTTMQHYKMPTRLLDTTSNPLVALYMACDKPHNVKNQKYGIGEVVIMNEDIKNIKYSESNAVILLSCLAVLETNYKQELYEKIVESIEKNDPSIYRDCLAYRRFVAEAHNELPYFDESFFKPEVLLKPRHVKVGMINERIISQSGNFILFGLCNYVTGDYMKLNTVAKERVFIVHRDYISKQLEMLNIDAGTMYPDKDHISVSITKSYD